MLRSLIGKCTVAMAGGAPMRQMSATSKVAVVLFWQLLSSNVTVQPIGFLGLGMLQFLDFY